MRPFTTSRRFDAIPAGTTKGRPRSLRKEASPTCDGTFASSRHRRPQSFPSVVHRFLRDDDEHIVAMELRSQSRRAFRHRPLHGIQTVADGALG